MSIIAFYAPLKPADHPTPSGDRKMARGLIKALEAANYTVHTASDLRSYDGKGDTTLQAEIAAQAAQEIKRITQSAPDYAAWITYHNYYKSPDLIGPAVAAHMNIPYIQIESTRAHKRLTGPWADFAKASEKACDRADAILYMTQHDQITLQAHKRAGQSLTYLAPFLHADKLPTAATPENGKLISIGMFRAGAKMQSYALIAETLAHLTSQWHIDIIGDGPARLDVEQLFVPFGNRVRLVGQCSELEVAQHLSTSALLFWPGVDEAYGMVYLEAQAAGVPVIAQDRAGVRDVIVGRGVDVSAGSEGLAEAIDHLLQDQNAHDTAATKARSKTAAHHLLPQASHTLAHVLKGLL